MFDFHIHIARLPQKKQLTQLLCDRKYDFVAVACEPWEWNEVAQLKKEFSTEFKPFMVSYGIHPMIATQANDEMFAKLRDFLTDDEHAMVGEAGIDKRYPGYDDGTQDKFFLAQAKLALEFKRHLQIHCVGDYQRVLKLLAEAGFPQETSQRQNTKGLQTLTRLQEAPRPIFHRFGGDLSVVKKAIPYGALFSLHADSFRKKSTVAAIPHIPQERVFFETDADETFMRGNANSATANANNVILNAVEDYPNGESRAQASDNGVILNAVKDPVTFTATTAPGTEAGMTRINKAGETNESAAGGTSPEEILAELEKRIESVRAAYAKCRE